MTNPLNKDSEKFWMVWNQSTGYTHQKHYVLNDAVDDWDSVNGKVNHSEGWDGVGDKL